jgi:hypothetical protein
MIIGQSDDGFVTLQGSDDDDDDGVEDEEGSGPVKRSAVAVGGFSGEI